MPSQIFTAFSGYTSKWHPLRATKRSEISQYAIQLSSDRRFLRVVQHRPDFLERCRGNVRHENQEDSFHAHNAQGPWGRDVWLVLFKLL